MENALATLIQLDRSETHSQIFSSNNIKAIERHRSSNNAVLRNLVSLFNDTAKHADNYQTGCI